jgi:hypothetical protein
MKWAADYSLDESHDSGPGPWSGHEESTTWTLAVEIHDGRFRLSWSWCNDHTASNRGRTERIKAALAGPAKQLRSGNWLLSAEESLGASRSYYEPPEDMWTPQVEEDEEEPAGPIPDERRFVLHAKPTDAGLVLALRSKGDWAPSSWLRQSNLFSCLKQRPLQAE